MHSISSTIATFLTQFGLARYLVVDPPRTGEFPAGAEVIVCQTCMEMVSRGVGRGELPPSATPRGIEKRFPGVPGKDARLKSGIFKRNGEVT